MFNEADTCRKYVVPNLTAAGWDKYPHTINEQYSFTDGRIIIVGREPRRGGRKQADYLLRYSHDFPIAVIEAKANYKLPADGMQQAKQYAEILGLKFAYATNGHGIVEFDYSTGLMRDIEYFPSPDDLWGRYSQAYGIKTEVQAKLLTPYNHNSGKISRYYQEIAINRVVEAIFGGRKRCLLTLATGTGKTYVAFQVCWILWNAGWNAKNERRHPKILYLSDRNILVDDPKDKMFAPFGEARCKIENGEAVKSRDLYFSTYQSIAEDERRPGLYKEYTPDFFDFIIVDECHRGSARDESNWHKILEYFHPSYQLGMTATPQRDENRDTYCYFGEPLYTYSLRQGIEDGFLAPYRVHHMVTNWDATGWSPSKEDKDRFGRDIPQGVYGSKEFEKIIAMRARTHAIALDINNYMLSTNPMAKTIVFCVDQEHALNMQQELTNLNSELVRRYPDYVCRVTANEGNIGRGHLSKFQETETDSPVILTTSQLLTTGVDAPTVKNIVIARVIESMVEFKQIIGRGTRLNLDHGKLFFTILDYTGSAVQKFSDSAFDGDPLPTGEYINSGKSKRTTPDSERKFYYDGGYVTIDHHLVYDMDPEGHTLRVVELSDYTKETIIKLTRGPEELRTYWSDSGKRKEIIARLEEKGISFQQLAEVMKRPDADPFDLLCHLAFNAPIKTRRERAEQIRNRNSDFFDKYSPKARTILNEILDKYEELGISEFTMPDVLDLPPIRDHGTQSEIVNLFGGAQTLRRAVDEMQQLIYTE